MVASHGHARRDGDGNPPMRSCAVSKARGRSHPAARLWIQAKLLVLIARTAGLGCGVWSLASCGDAVVAASLDDARTEPADADTQLGPLVDVDVPDELALPDGAQATTDVQSSTSDSDVAELDDADTVHAQDVNASADVNDVHDTWANDDGAVGLDDGDDGDVVAGIDVPGLDSGGPCIGPADCPTPTDGCVIAICAPAGKCMTGAKLCVDGNACTLDSCLPASGCQFVPTTAPCDDGNLCTIADGCVAGICVSGAQEGCDDGNPCTADSCLAGLGCQHASLTDCPQSGFTGSGTFMTISDTKGGAYRIQDQGFFPQKVCLGAFCAGGVFSP